MTKIKHLLLDGDIIAFRASVLRKDEEGVNPEESTVVERMIDQINFIKTNTGFNSKTDKITVCLTHSKNYRKTVYPAYKENRDPGAKPTLLGFARQYLQDNYVWKIMKNLEADDVMGIMSTDPKFLDSETRIICTSDKDLTQIPGYIFNPGKSYLGVYKIEPHEADRVFYTQWLTGDSTDNYSGAPGVGPKKAEKILQVPQEYWDEDVQDTYKSLMMTQEYCVAQARLARILRFDDYDHDKQEPILWTPKPTDVWKPKEKLEDAINDFPI